MIDRATRRRWVEEGRVRVDGRVAGRIDLLCRAGACIEIEPVSDSLLPSFDEAPGRCWLAWVDAPAADRGSLEVGTAGRHQLEVLSRREGLAAVAVRGAPCRAAEVCEALARAGLPVVGDLARAGLGVPGGPRIRPLAEGVKGATPDAKTIESGWPDEPAWPREEPGGESGRGPASEPLVLRVSDATRRAIVSGHPWILADEASESAEAFRPGTLVRVDTWGGRPLGWAHIEGDERLAARVWALGAIEARAIDSVDSRVARALARRRSLWAREGEAATDAFRLIHGEADDLPGLFVDRLGPMLRVLVTGRATEGFRDRVIEALRAQLPVTPEGESWSILELQHLRAARGCLFDGLRWLAGGVEALAESGAEIRGEWLRVEERGLRFWVDPGWDAPRRVRAGFGLFLDQRENRARLDPSAAGGGRWLNLFAHTGAFSVSLLAAGAQSVVSVDLSRPYLGRLEANLDLNGRRGVDARCHESVRGDGRRYLETLDADQRFAGIVLDPPTAAAAGRRFWSVRQDLEPLVRRCVAHLDEGGTLLVTQNRRGVPLGLDRLLERAVARAYRRVARLEPAGPGTDHPTRAGFPEGDAFEGWLLVLE
jgi:23S rRNA (cytosine1962-C5)-methyltransferase